ncbi:hypothetical protein [Bacillus wiedmannii]|uniref:hypothetical protein n=1 Tax=Bacillus wiedmannii TaxID=1890302 RepID=UPI00065BEA16|nr:hypothetical protein [Bacillus wiedmannii]KMP29177.1 membrane protein [Bacillus wiedmannii]MED2838231.1 hypothetical protein [Bacillus wiedmannii]
MKAFIKALKWTTGISHLILIACYYLTSGLVDLYGIPPLTVITLHIITILLAKKEDMNTYPHLIGIIVTLVAFFPYIDIVLHMIATFFLLLDAASTTKKEVLDS